MIIILGGAYKVIKRPRIAVENTAKLFMALYRFKNYRSVMSTKTKGVAHGYIYFTINCIP
jgi:hypothetical protein